MRKHGFGQCRTAAGDEPFGRAGVQRPLSGAYGASALSKGGSRMETIGGTGARAGPRAIRGRDAGGADPLSLGNAVEAAARRSEGEDWSRAVLDRLPVAIYTTDPEGRITYYNQAAADFAGRRPEIGKDRWCVSWRLYRTDGTPLPHDQCPMAVALRENRPVRGVEAILERPDGSRVWFVPFPTPVHDASGTLVGAVNLLVDITDRKAAENARARLAAIV